MEGGQGDQSVLLDFSLKQDQPWWGERLGFERMWRTETQGGLTYAGTQMMTWRKLQDSFCLCWCSWEKRVLEGKAWWTEACRRRKRVDRSFSMALWLVLTGELKCIPWTKHVGTVLATWCCCRIQETYHFLLCFMIISGSDWLELKTKRESKQKQIPGPTSNVTEMHW